MTKGQGTAMSGQHRRGRADAKTHGGLFARLRRDVRANTLAIMAAALIPIIAVAGSAVDMARLHVVRVRLQQACDAGVLAGRKFLPVGTTANVNLVTASVPSTSTVAASDGRSLAGDGAQANSYFNNNLETSWGGGGWYNTGTDKFNAFTVADAQGNTQVGGTAQADVNMTLMKIFNFNMQTIKVQCQAAFSTPDTDVMFVLDTTGSMGCAVTRSESSCTKDWAGLSSNQMKQSNADGSTSYYVKEEMSGSTNISRIDALRQAVNAFYTQVATTKDSSTNVRYGFVPYTSTVNVGTLLYGLSSSYLVSTWTYQSRTPTDDYIIKTTSSKTVAATSEAACKANYSRTPANRTNASTGDANPGYPNGGTATADDPVWTPATGNGTDSGNGNSSAKCTVNTDQIGPVWSYKGGVQYDLSKYLTGNSMTDPARLDGSTTVWNGCIEDRDTTSNTTTFDQSNLPPDLDPDLTPSSDATRWRPMWADVVYHRNLVTIGGRDYNYTTPWASRTYADNSGYTLYNYNDAKLTAGGAASCPAIAKPLFLPDPSTGASVISNYVAGLRALGGTYHDVGMIWGTRMLSPTGIWRSNNNWPSGRAAPKRVLVFVTDGTMSPGGQVYGGYSVEYPDRRVTGTGISGDPDAGKNADGTCTDTSANCYKYINYHNQRFLAECAKAKSSPLNYDVWVVEVAQASSTQLTTCASRPSQVLVGQTTDQLKTAFQQIAQQVAMLRVSQ